MNPLRIVVIAGPANSGKMPLARCLMALDTTLGLVHRDFIRTSLESPFDEGEITLLMGYMARGILAVGRSPIIVAWNMHQMDFDLWTELSDDFIVPLTWYDTRSPEVQAMIPQLQTEIAA
jgi:hypothetical protein